ncbi:HNH endonuclease signature motif containing protein [Nocardia africana]
MSLIQKLYANTEFVPQGCWNWTRAKSAAGYGVVRPAGSKQVVYTHRASFEFHRGPIPTGMDIDHLCRNRACCNPTHLEAVTHQVNMLRAPFTALDLHRNKTHCVNGHEFTPENTYQARSQRRCKTCRKASDAARYLRRKAAK